MTRGQKNLLIRVSRLNFYFLPYNFFIFYFFRIEVDMAYTGPPKSVHAHKHLLKNTYKNQCSKGQMFPTINLIENFIQCKSVLLIF
jgi:hypothetical protein